MKRFVIAGAAFVAVLVAMIAVGLRALDRGREPREATAATSSAVGPSTATAGEEARSTPVSAPGFLYGRVTAVDGAVYEGRLRFGGNQEAFWGDYFNGARKENPWVAHVPPERLRLPGRPIEIFGLDFGSGGTAVEIGRQLMARFGEIARLESRGREVRVTLKSGTVVDVDRFEASDFDDGLRIWDAERGVVDLDSLRIRTIDFLPTPPLAAAPERLHGTVRTRQGEFTGFVAWHQQAVFGVEELEGRSAEGRVRLRFDTLRSIERDAGGGSRVTLADGRALDLSGTDEVDDGNHGISVDDRRYGRVQIDWEAFERVDFDPPGREGSGPAYDEFPPGRSLAGRVTDRSGRVLAGRLVYDLDESETTDTLDAQDREVHYTIPFGRIAAIVPGDPDEEAEDGDDDDEDAEDDLGFSRVSLQGGEELRLERTGDLGDGNAGLLVFVPGAPHPEHLPWTDLARLDLDPPPPAEPPGGGGEPLR